MFFHAMRKNKILRVLCILMFILVHLDAYVYETINAFHIESVEQSVPFVGETLQREDEAGMPSWDDFSYFKVSSRLSWWDIGSVFLPLLLLFCFIPIVRIRNSMQGFLSLGTLKVRPHLIFCTFLI